MGQFFLSKQFTDPPDWNMSYTFYLISMPLCTKQHSARKQNDGKIKSILLSNIIKLLKT